MRAKLTLPTWIRLLPKPNDDKEAVQKPISALPHVRDDAYTSVGGMGFPEQLGQSVQCLLADQ